MYSAEAGLGILLITLVAVAAAQAPRPGARAAFLPGQSEAARRRRAQPAAPGRRELGCKERGDWWFKSRGGFDVVDARPGPSPRRGHGDPLRGPRRDLIVLAGGAAEGGRGREDRDLSHGQARKHPGGPLSGRPWV